MHFLLISGSPALFSHTLILMQELNEEIERMGHSSTIWNLQHMPLPLCEPQYHWDIDAHPDSEVQRFAKEVRAADGIALGSPLYHGSFSGVLKNSLDHLWYDAFRNKPVALLSHGSSERRCSIPCEMLQTVVKTLFGYCCQTQVASTKTDFEQNEDGPFRMENNALRQRIHRQAHELVQLSGILKEHSDLVKEN